MNDAAVRLELLKVLIPQTSKYGLTEPQMMIDTCTQLEKYVLDSKQGENLPDSPTAKRMGRPRKGQVEPELSSNPDPTHGGQVESNPR
jgi:hypothetical protein